MTLIYVGATPPPTGGPTAGILQWKSYVMRRWPGGTDLGTWVVRNVRNGTSLSVHAVGRAWDWRYVNPGPGRATAEAAMEFAIEHHELLGIQAIHDYVSARIWRSSRPGTGPGWKDQPRVNEMGAPWATWLHWEVHPASPLHQRSVAEVLRRAGVTDDQQSGSKPASEFPAPTLRRGDRGDRVVHLQRILAFWGFYRFAVDGDFGPLTEAAVAAWQRSMRNYEPGPVDGIYGPRTRAAAVRWHAALRRWRAAVNRRRAA
jgi:hypothetical protein